MRVLAKLLGGATFPELQKYCFLCNQGKDAM